MAQEAQSENGSKASPVVFAAVKPWLVVEAPKANDAVQFYKAAFGAEELGSSSIVVSDLTDDASAPVKSPVSGSLFCLETEDVEAAVSKAVAAGAVAEGEVSEGEGACCGGRVGRVKDPYGNVWLICSPSKKCADVAA
ncbi:UNVERIFIED_CONTAM: hypothetical protein Scaly_0385800 [Sesamum calycinum]|uniref:VOC domain-containing protein n=1 Tax=Sesamum calycinum TaxID=2727403 RepID=A0AAW2SCU4_9LAMI